MARTSQRARLVIAPSQAAATDISRVMDISADRIVVILRRPIRLVPDDTGAASAMVAEKRGVTPYLFNIGGYDCRRICRSPSRRSLQHCQFVPMVSSSGSTTFRQFPDLGPGDSRVWIQNRVVRTGRFDEDRRAALSGSGWLRDGL